LGVVARMRANSTNGFSSNPSQLITYGAEGLSLATEQSEGGSPRSITSSNSSAMDAILEQARMLSQGQKSRPPSPPVQKQNSAIPSCMRRARSIPPPPSSRPAPTPTPTFNSSSDDVKELKEIVNILQKRNQEYEEKLAGLQSYPFYGIVKDEAIYFYKNIPSNEKEWEENKEGEASQNDWVPVLHAEKRQGSDLWVSVLYMDPETGETDVFWTLKNGFAVFSLYPLLDRTVEDLV